MIFKIINKKFKLTINATNQLQKVLLVDQLNYTKVVYQLYKWFAFCS